ncbi:hypothetical protein J45TS6_09400 [Paenibacillus sp. J45TS6]|nr:hypothetical protein J45TS6_09400 [Paenibacillus sp. J45TS6]
MFKSHLPSAAIKNMIKTTDRIQILDLKELIKNTFFNNDEYMEMSIDYYPGK